MSEDYHIGLSREQVEKLLKGEEVGKRAYYKDTEYPQYDTPRKYANVRIHIKMLTEEEQKKEPDGAFYVVRLWD